MNKRWNRNAIERLLRYGRKNDGGWCDIELFWDEENQCVTDESMPDDDDADLIAAAPDLLAALESLHSLIDFDVPMIKGVPIVFEDLSGINEAMRIARQAIRKAKGGNS
jgi:hypothetical protein